MSHNSCKVGYVYIYKVVVGNSHNFVKIGVSKDYVERMHQHVRTPYQGFICFLNFLTCEPVVTAFKVADMDLSDDLVQGYFKKYQLGDIEVYNINYNDAIKELYTLLKKHNQFIELVEDKITDYSFLKDDGKILVDTSKSAFEIIKQELLSKYDGIPNEVLKLLRTKVDIQYNCPSHLKYGNYVEFPNDMILDLHFDKAGRVDILTQLSDLL